MIGIIRNLAAVGRYAVLVGATVLLAAMPDAVRAESGSRANDAGDVEFTYDGVAKQTLGADGSFKLQNGMTLMADGSIKLPSGSGISCNAAHEGAIRWNGTNKYLEVCNGKTWRSPFQTQGYVWESPTYDSTGKPSYPNGPYYKLYPKGRCTVPNPATGDCTCMLGDGSKVAGPAQMSGQLWYYADSDATAWTTFCF